MPFFVVIGNTLLYTDATLECESLSVQGRGEGGGTGGGGGNGLPMIKIIQKFNCVYILHFHNMN